MHTSYNHAISLLDSRYRRVMVDLNYSAAVVKESMLLLRV